MPFADDLSVGNFYSGLAPTIQAAGLEVFMTSPNFLREKNAADIVNEFAGLVYYAATSNDYLDLLFELALMNFPVVVLDKRSMIYLLQPFNQTTLLVVKQQPNA